jgi:mRNA-degrading endonuclease YafQ of YafQ-DinJ toxin-antitoxin module
MPTFEWSARFRRDYARLTTEQHAAFHRAVDALVVDLGTGKFRPSLRVHKLRYTPLWSMTWAPDGRATFRLGVKPDTREPHIIWRRIGGHEIYR